MLAAARVFVALGVLACLIGIGVLALAAPRGLLGPYLLAGTFLGGGVLMLTAWPQARSKGGRQETLRRGKG